MKLKDTDKLAKKTILLIIVSILFLLTTQSLFSQEENNVLIQTDKAQYIIGETVYVTVSGADTSKYNLYYEYEGLVQRYMGDFSSFSFVPVGIGTHYIILTDKTYNEIKRISFEVIEAEQPEQPLLEQLLEEQQPLQSASVIPFSGQPMPISRQGLMSLKQFFKQQEDAEFEFSYEPKQKIQLTEKLKQKGTWETSRESIITELTDSQGNKQKAIPEFERVEDGRFKIIISKNRTFRAGLYTLRVELAAEGTTYVEEQSFLWGVLAVNTEKSVYLPGESAFIGIAVLDDAGYMVCDADVTLEIINPSGIKTTLSTSDKTISVSPECSVYGITNLPDYYTTYTAAGIGNYTMNLTAVTRNGARSLNDNFVAQDSVEFDVARKGPTRIYPFVPYSMNFTIKANKDYSGQVVEYVPASFEIASQPGLIITTINDTKILSWNANLIAGETYTLSYEFDAPDISPYLFNLGKLQIGGWQEERNWMIASDYDSYNNVVNITTNSSWVVPEGVSWVLVQAYGGGGAGGYGGSGSYNGGGGGAGGQYAKKNVTVIAGENYTIKIGTAGSAVASGNGNPGGDTTFNSTVAVVAKGGAGGQSYANGAAGGAGTNASGAGDVVYAGGSGANGASNFSGGGGGGAGIAGPGGNATTYGAGSGTPLGGNGGAGTTGNSAVGGSGNPYGGGGGGGTKNKNGGDGAAGFLQLLYDIIDSVAPTVNINTSLNNTGTYDRTPNIQFNFTDSLSSTANCTLYFNDTALNYTGGISRNTTTTLTVNTSQEIGRYDVWINCTDESNNIGMSGIINITIDPDTTPPTVNINASRNNTFTSDTTPDVEFNFTDIVSQTVNCTLYFDDAPYNTTNDINKDAQTTLTVNDTLSPTNYSVYINCTDESNNIGKSSVIHIIIDTTTPTININTSLNNTIFTTGTPIIDFNYSDSLSANASCALYFDSVSAATNSSTLNWTNTVLTSSSQSDGNYSVYINCTDLANNIGKSDVLNIEVDTTAPAISAVTNDSITENSARINWTTDEAANGSVKYGTTTDLTDDSVNASDLVLLHNISLTGLSVGTLCYYNITSCDAQGWCNTTGTYNFTTTTAANTPPTIDTVDAVPSQAPNPEAEKIVEFNFTVTDLDGSDTLNHSSARVIVNKSGITRTGNCSNNTVDSDTVRYNCSLAMQYFDEPGAWTINVTIIDNGQLSAYNATTDFTYQELLYIQVSPVVFGFGDFYPGQQNQSAISNPLLIDNLGNVNLTQINITAYDLVNGSYTLGAGNISVNVSGTSSTVVQHSSGIVIPDARINLDVDGVDDNESLHFYISAPNLPALVYSSSTDWVISADK